VASIASVYPLCEIYKNDQCHFFLFLFLILGEKSKTEVPSAMKLSKKEVYAILNTQVENPTERPKRASRGQPS